VDYLSICQTFAASPAEPGGLPGEARGPRAELATLQDAARFIGQMKPWRQARPYWDFVAGGCCDE
jgi:hypothetical protein